jgi:hypothetical protein
MEVSRNVEPLHLIICVLSILLKVVVAAVVLLGVFSGAHTSNFVRGSPVFLLTINPRLGSIYVC